MVEALEAARLRIEELEIEKSHALKRFEEMTGRLHRLMNELKELKAKAKP
jgi:hypothetical protein